MSLASIVLKVFGFGALAQDANGVPLQGATGHTFEDANTSSTIISNGTTITSTPVKLTIPENARAFRIGPIDAALLVGNNQYLDSTAAGRGAEKLGIGDSVVYGCTDRSKDWYIAAVSTGTKINLTFMY